MYTEQQAENEWALLFCSPRTSTWNREVIHSIRQFRNRSFRKNALKKNRFNLFNSSIFPNLISRMSNDAKKNETNRQYEMNEEENWKGKRRVKKSLLCENSTKKKATFLFWKSLRSSSIDKAGGQKSTVYRLHIGRYKPLEMGGSSEWSFSFYSARK